LNRGRLSHDAVSDPLMLQLAAAMRSGAENSELSWLTKLGLTLAFIAVVVFLWKVLLILVAVIGTAILLTILRDRWRAWRAIRRFRTVWGTQGKDLLLVYSNSPHWQHYVEATWLPRWGHRAVVLNWSERSQWTDDSRPEVALFRAFGGGYEFNPLGIVVPKTGRKVHVVRFWRAFRDHKHGKAGPLQAAEAELSRLLETSTTGVPDRLVNGV
jgi:hypothetical protein